MPLIDFCASSAAGATGQPDSLLQENGMTVPNLLSSSSSSTSSSSNAAILFLTLSYMVAGSTGGSLRFLPFVFCVPLTVVAGACCVVGVRGTGCVGVGGAGGAEAGAGGAGPGGGGLASLADAFGGDWPVGVPFI